MAGPSKGPEEGSSGGGVVELAEDAVKQARLTIESLGKQPSIRAVLELGITSGTGGTEVAGSTPPAPKVDLTAPVVTTDKEEELA